MRLALLLVFVALPILEIALLVRAGQVLGFWPTLGIVVATAIAGTYLLRRQGFHILRRLADDFRQGRPPLEPIADGAMLLVAGAFLLTPGFVTDAAGFLLLIPQVRAYLQHALVARLLASSDINVTVFTSETVYRTPSDDEPHGFGRRPDQDPNADGPIIEGEFERIDERTRNPRR